MIYKVTRPIVVPGGPHIDGRPLSRVTERSATWGPTVHGLSLVDAQAFLRVQGVDLSPYADAANRHLIRVYDSTRKAATGYIDVAGGGEALGAELVTNGDNEAAAATFGTSTASRGTRSQSAEQARGGANSLKFLKNADAGTGYLNFNDTTLALVSPGKLYDIAFWVYLPSGQTGHTVRTDWWYHNVPAWPRVRIDVTTTDTWVQVAFRGTVNNHCQFNVQLMDGVDTDKFYLDDFTIKEVTDCATDGVHIVSSPGGAQNWKSIQPGFLYNDSAYKLEVFKAR